jgi:hypothetical protein
MRGRGFRAAWHGAGASLAATLAATALIILPPVIAGARAQDRQNLNPEDVLAPSQMAQPMPAPVSEPGAAAKKKPPERRAAAAKPDPANPEAAKPGPGSAPVHAPRAGSFKTVIECKGPFAKDSGMLALAVTYDSRNMIFTHEKVQGTDVGVTVLFPKDPKRRLEVWWQNANRTGLYLIDIAGKSGWVAPKGLRLGLTLDQVEKLNHKPFKLKGFDADGVAAVADWDGGELASLPGGCKASASVQVKAKSAAGELPAKDEYSSDDPAMRALKPTVSEILIGY